NRCVLSVGEDRRFAEAARRLCQGRQIREGTDVAETQLLQVGERRVFESKHVPQRVAPFISPLRRIGHLTDPGAVKNHQDEPPEPSHNATPGSSIPFEESRSQETEVRSQKPEASITTYHPFDSDY